MKLLDLAQTVKYWLDMRPENDLLDIEVFDQYGRTYRIARTNCSYSSFNIIIEPKE